MGRACLAAALAALAVCAAAPAQPRVDRAATLSVYGGLGSWMDIFAGRVWSQPEAVVATMRAHGVRTLYLQTGNYSQTVDVVRPEAVAALVEAAHRAGIHVVAWYLPSFTDPREDARRSIAAIRFRTPGGERFDSFALDIEASLEHDVRLRNSRLLALSRLLRTTAPAGYPLGAIIPSPLGMRRHPHYWPSFPYAPLARLYDAILPMAYFTNYTRTAPGAYAYARGVVAALRTATARPGTVIHLIGGISAAAPPAAFGAFRRAASECGVDGLSLYAFPLTTAAEWAQLAAAGGLSSAAACG